MGVVLDELGDGNGAAPFGNIQTSVALFREPESAWSGRASRGGERTDDRIDVGALVGRRDAAFVAAKRLALDRTAAGTVELGVPRRKGRQGDGATLVRHVRAGVSLGHRLPVGAVGDGRRDDRVGGRYGAGVAAELLAKLDCPFDAGVLEGWVVLVELFDGNRAPLLGDRQAGVARFRNGVSQAQRRRGGSENVPTTDLELVQYSSRRLSRRARRAGMVVSGAGARKVRLLPRTRTPDAPARQEPLVHWRTLCWT